VLPVYVPRSSADNSPSLHHQTNRQLGTMSRCTGGRQRRLSCDGLPTETVRWPQHRENPLMPAASCPAVIGLSASLTPPHSSVNALDASGFTSSSPAMLSAPGGMRSGEQTAALHVSPVRLAVRLRDRHKLPVHQRWHVSASIRADRSGPTCRWHRFVRRGRSPYALEKCTGAWTTTTNNPTTSPRRSD
jgi:hypothetical protein